MASTRLQETYPGTVAEELDQLEILASKIGLISSRQAFEILHGLDHALERIEELEEGSQSRRLAETQFELIFNKINAEAGRFVGDLGGVQALRNERANVNPPRERAWWFVDEFIAEKRRSTLKRVAIIGGVVVVAFIVLAVVYQKFFAPDPRVAAVYGHTQSAQDFLINNDPVSAMQEVEKGLQVNPTDPSLLMLKGVLLESQGNITGADQAFAAAHQGLPNEEDFLLTRAQTYIFANKVDKALADTQAVIQKNPQSPQAYLLSGQAHEILGQNMAALDDYDKAFQAAEKTGRTELAALARARTAFLMQRMNPVGTLQAGPTPTP